MRPGDKDLEQEQRYAARTHDAAHRALCVEAVTEWNRLMERRYKPRWSPMIGVAIAARFYFLDVYCPGCRQFKQVDLRPLGRHPQMTLFGLIPALSCQSCQPSPPFAQLVKLSQYKWESANAPAYLPRRGL
jgi:hypothetical protein